MKDHKQRTILVVEDTSMIRLLLLRHLKQEGYEHVLAATNGQEALDMLKTQPVDLVLLDIQMPVMDGYEALAKIRADPALKETAVIMITAVDKIESVARCIEMGAEDYMPKLFNPILLNARIGACLTKLSLLERIRELEAKTGS